MPDPGRGSTPIVPPLPGIKGDNVVVVNNYYLESHKVGDSVVVLGGGLAGCECAVHLQQAGKTVHLVEMRNTLLRTAISVTVPSSCRRSTRVSRCIWHRRPVRNRRRTCGEK